MLSIDRQPYSRMHAQCEHYNEVLSISLVKTLHSRLSIA